MMQKYAIEAAECLMNARKVWSERKCTREFYDVVYHGGPGTFETLRETRVECGGVYETLTKTGRFWEYGDHKEYVWRAFHHGRECKTITVFSRCNKCGAEWGHGEFIQAFEDAPKPTFDAPPDHIPW